MNLARPFLVLADRLVDWLVARVVPVGDDFDPGISE